MRAKYIENLQSAAQAALYVNVLAAGANAFAFLKASTQYLTALAKHHGIMRSVRT